jgi:predicted Zn-dependent peptidase
MQGTLHTKRSKAPAFLPIVSDEQLSLDYRQLTLRNGFPLCYLDQPAPAVCRLELVVPAGTRYQETPLVASLTARLLKEGAAGFQPEDIASHLDYYGAYFESQAERDRASMVLYAPRRFMGELLPLFAAVWAEATFPEESLRLEIQQMRQELKINPQRVGWIARQAFQEALYGPAHPYGLQPRLEHFDALERTQLLKHFSTHYHHNEAYLTLAGEVDEMLLKEIDRHLGAVKLKKPPAGPFSLPEAQPASEGLIRQTRPEAVQSALRVGRRLFHRTHPDFMGMQFLVSLLGGYFGSRLMKNLREDKGLTYGVNAFIQAFEEDTFMAISTEVGAEKEEEALEQIRLELSRLREAPPKKAEMDHLRNYLLGSMLRALDGPLAKIERLRNLLDARESPDYFIRLRQQILSIQAVGLHQLACRYLNENELTFLSAGPLAEKSPENGGPILQNESGTDRISYI